MQDKQFIDHMVTVIAVLIGVAALILIIAKVLSETHQEPDQAMLDTIHARIKPVGEVHLGIPPAAAALQPVAQVANTTMNAQTTDNAMSAEATYQAVCAVCHAAGIAGSPIYGDKAAWASRLADIEALYTNSIQGKGAMPAKGGRPDLSDEAIKAAVDYMVEAVR